MLSVVIEIGVYLRRSAWVWWLSERLLPSSLISFATTYPGAQAMTGQVLEDAVEKSQPDNAGGSRDQHLSP